MPTKRKRARLSVPQTSEDSLTGKSAVGSSIKSKRITRVSPKKAENQVFASKKRPGRHVCQVCNESFSNTLQLNTHVSKAHKQTGRSRRISRSTSKIEKEAHRLYLCQFCPRTFADQYLLDDHSKTHSPKINSRLSCTECSKTFLKEPTLISHMLKVHNLLKCVDCDNYFTSSSSLKAHRNACHSGTWMKKTSADEAPKIHDKCRFCDKTFESSFLTITHMTMIHCGLQCPKCHLWCRGRVALKDHLASCSRRLINVSCHFCQKHFSSVNTLASHVKLCCRKVRTQHNESNRLVSLNGTKNIDFKCGICNQFFGSKDLLYAHRDQCQSEFRCSICGKCFPTNPALNKHVRIFHTGGKPFQCKICKKRFSHSNLLKVHFAMFHQKNSTEDTQSLPSINKKKVHKCRVCRKGFMQYSFLKMHMHVHTAEKQLKCGLCGERFATEKTVIEHINIFHLANSNGSSLENVKYLAECINSCDTLNHGLISRTTILDRQGEVDSPIIPDTAKNCVQIEDSVGIGSRREEQMDATMCNGNDGHLQHHDQVLGSSERVPGQNGDSGLSNHGNLHNEASDDIDQTLQPTSSNRYIIGNLQQDTSFKPQEQDASFAHLQQNVSQGHFHHNHEAQYGHVHHNAAHLHEGQAGTPNNQIQPQEQNGFTQGQLTEHIVIESLACDETQNIDLSIDSDIQCENKDDQGDATFQSQDDICDEIISEDDFYIVINNDSDEDESFSREDVPPSGHAEHHEHAGRDSGHVEDVNQDEVVVVKSERDDIESSPLKPQTSNPQPVIYKWI